MTTFQISAFVFLGLALAATISFRLRRQASFRVAFAWSLLWIGAAVAIAWPQITVRVAHFLGIARGADLVFYLAILGMFVGFFAVYVRFRTNGERDDAHRARARAAQSARARFRVSAGGCRPR